MSIKIIPVVNPHQKVEGIQNVRPKEIEQMLNKAKNVPIKIEGDFVKLQNYQFTVDEFEEMDDPNKKKKKQGKKESAKKGDIQKGDIKKDEQKVEEEQVEEQVEEQQQEKQEEQQEQEEQEEQENNEAPQESEVDYEDMQKQLKESQSQQLSQSQQQSQSQVQKSSLSQKKKKFQSGYAAMMDDLLNESLAEKEEEQVIPQPVEEQQQDQQKEQEYLKIIKSYQQKLKQLNEIIENKQPVLSEIIDEQQLQEELDKTEESFTNKKHLYPGINGISLYDEFRLPKLVEEQVEYRLQELGIKAEENVKIQELEQQHQDELDNVKQQYELQIQQLKEQLELEKQRVLQAEKIRYAESDISKVLSKSEVERLYKDPRFSVMSSNLMPSVDSDVSEVMKDESVYLKYRDVLKQQKQPRHIDIVNSNLHQILTKQEVQELMKQDTDSRLSISALMSLDGALNILQQNVNSDIDSIINEQEQKEFKKDPKYNESSLPDSSIQFSIPEHQKLQRLIDSDISNFQMNQNASIFDELQLEQQESNKFIISQKLIDEQQKIFDKEVQKLCEDKPKFKTQIINDSINSSIGSLAQQSIPQNISSNIDSSQNQSIIGSIISNREKNSLLQQNNIQQQESSISQVSGDINQISSNISQLNSLIDSNGNSSITKILNNKSNLKSLSNVSSSYSSVQSYLLLKQQLNKKKY